MAQSINPAWASRQRQLPSPQSAAVETGGLKNVSLSKTIKIVLVILLAGVCFSLYRQTGFELQRAAGRKAAAQANRQTSQPQFHWGKPPPAAEPSTKADRRLMRRLSRQPTDFESETDVRSELGRQVAVDLEADADFDEGRGRPGHEFLHSLWVYNRR